MRYSEAWRADKSRQSRLALLVHLVKNFPHFSNGKLPTSNDLSAILEVNASIGHHWMSRLVKEGYVSTVYRQPKYYRWEKDFQ